MTGRLSDGAATVIGRMTERPEPTGRRILAMEERAWVDGRMRADQSSWSSQRDDLTNGPIVLFDAECVLCSANAQFILKHDKAARFHLASMQGDVGAALFREHGLDPSDPSTIIVVEGSRIRLNSDAVLSIYEGLGFPWRLVFLLRIVPASLRDPIYRWVARNRYRIFGKRQTCWLPPREYRSRVL